MTGRFRARWRKARTTMKMLLNVLFSLEPFNALVRAGECGKVMNDIFDDVKPEAAYFTEQGGHRSVILLVNVNNPSEVPKLAEPFFLKFNAECRFRIVMSPEDLQNAGLDGLGTKWG